MLCECRTKVNLFVQNAMKILNIRNQERARTGTKKGAGLGPKHEPGQGERQEQGQEPGQEPGWKTI